jgi:Uma2 family endonuclease
MAKVLDRPKTEHENGPTLEERYQAVQELFPDYRVELINSRIVVNEVPTGVHNDVIALLLFQLTKLLVSNDWRPWTNIKLFLGAQRDVYIPDLVIVPRKRRMWGTDAVYAADTLLVVEVVSPSSMHDDYDIKPSAYALAGVPLYLRVDPLHHKVHLMGNPDGKGAYLDQTEVPMGKPLDLPEPWNLTIDTRFVDDDEPEAEGEAG